MKVGVSTATFFSKLLTEDTFSVIKLCGGELAEVFLTTFYEYQPSFGKILKERLDGVEVFSIHSLNTTFEPQLFNVVPRTRDDAEKTFRDVLEVGRIIGAKYYTFHGGTRLKKTTVINEEFAGKRLQELAEIAQEYGIRLCLETVHWAMFNSPEFFSNIKQYCPDLGAVLDIKQARQSDRDWREYLDAIGDRLCNVHITDVKDGKIVMVGQGDFPFEELVTRLKNNNYQGPLMVEQYAKNYSDFSEIKQSVEYTKKIIGGIYAN